MSNYGCDCYVYHSAPADKSLNSNKHFMRERRGICTNILGCYSFEST